MKVEKKKTPSDYPQFAFRVANETKKDELNALIDEVKQLYNANRSEDQKIINKNDIIIEALEKGLNLMKKSKSR